MRREQQPQQNPDERFNCFLLVPNGSLWHCLRGEYHFRQGKVFFDKQLKIFSNFGPYSLENTVEQFLEAGFMVTEVERENEEPSICISLSEQVPLNAEQFLLLAMNHMERQGKPGRNRRRRRR
jgi:hypothetical protein